MFESLVSVGTLLRVYFTKCVVERQLFNIVINLIVLDGFASWLAQR